MAFWNTALLQLEEFRLGILSKAEIGLNLTRACMKIEPNQEDAGLEHPFEQCGVVLDGHMEMFIGDECMTLGPKQCYIICSGIRHGWKTGSQSVKILDVSAKLPYKVIGISFR